MNGMRTGLTCVALLALMALLAGCLPEENPPVSSAPPVSTTQPAVPGLAAGETLFFEGFEDGRGEAAPGGWWSTHNSDQRVTDETASQGTKSCRQNYRQWWAGGRHRALVLPDGPFVLSFDMRLSSKSKTANGRMSNLRVVYQSPQWTVGAGIHSHGEGGKRATNLFVHGRQYTDIPIPAKLDTWYVFEARVTPATKTVDYYYRTAGESDMKPLALAQSYADRGGQPGHVSFLGGGDEPTAVAYVDNIKIAKLPSE